MVNQPRGRALGRVCLDERRGHELRRHAMPERVADEFTGVDILDTGQIQPALTGPDVGDVGHPGLVRTRGVKLLIEQVFRHWQVMVRVGGRFELAPLLAA